METLPGVAPPEQQNTYFYIGQHETRRTVPVTTELGNQAQDAGVSFFLSSLCSGRVGYCCVSSMRLY
jgi:protein arginine N-methyltransferase 5